MGVKFQSHLIIRWWFQLMGNRISWVHPSSSHSRPTRTIKLIKSDGLVNIYDRPIHVAKLMMEFPKHMVCRSDSFYIGQKIQALSEDDQLQLGHKYFLLPSHCFQSVLSFVSIASFINTTSQPPSNAHSRNAFLRKVGSCQPFHIQKSPSGCLRIRLSDEFISQLMEEGRLMKATTQEHDASTPTSRVCTTPQLQKDYSLLVSSRHWKPKLDPITESDKKLNKLSSFGIKRKKKSQTKPSHKTPRSSKHHTSAAIKTSSRPKIKFKIKSSRK